MVATLLTQAVFIVVVLACPWELFAEILEVEMLKPNDYDQTLFRIYLLLFPALHLILAIAIEVRSMFIQNFIIHNTLICTL